MNENEGTRARILGELIREARVRAGRSIDDCAGVLAIPPEAFIQAEAGEHVVSLPELEVLAIYLQVPMAYFWGSQKPASEPEPDFQTLLTLRHRMLGVQLRQARLDAEMSIEELAAKTGLPVEEVQHYEASPESISLLTLERISRALDLSLDDFVYAARGPMARHEQEQRYRRYFAELPAEVKDFVTQPVNLAYLETAIRLSKMDTQHLRQIAEGILDITL